MPTYAYACTECDHDFETVQSFSDDALTTCPECQGRLRKVFNSVGVVFKGSGFYRNDSRNGGKGGSQGAGTTSTSDSGNSSTSAQSSSSSSTSGTSTSSSTSSSTTSSPTTSSAAS